MTDSMHTFLSLILLVICALVCCWLYWKSRSMHRIWKKPFPTRVLPGEDSPSQADSLALQKKLIAADLTKQQAECIAGLLSEEGHIRDTLATCRQLQEAGFTNAQAEVLTYALYERARPDSHCGSAKDAFRPLPSSTKTEAPLQKTEGLRLWIGLLFLAQTVLLLCVLRAFMS